MNPEIKPVAVSTWHDDRKYLKWFLETARRNGIDPQNADPELWPGRDWTEIPWWRKTKAQHNFIVSHSEFTHFLFTDSYDIVFAAGWDEIIEKYMLYGSPIVFGTESNCWPKPSQASLYPPTFHRSKYLNAGFWIGERESSIPFLAEAARRAEKKEQCDSGIFVDMFLSRQWPVILDTACRLFFCCNMDSLDFLEPTQDSRLVCKDTGHKPCLFHGNGNSNLVKVIEGLHKP